MKGFCRFIAFAAAVALAVSCSHKRAPRTVILAAEEAEFNKCRECFPDVECILTGVGAGNVIRTCSALLEGTRVISIGYAGSNCLEIGTVTLVSDSYRLKNDSYVLDDYASPLHLSDTGYPDYTSNSFVTESDMTEPALFDMELNYIAAFTPRIELVAAIKIVSDNLSVEDFQNNAIRESGILTSDDVWARVKSLAGQAMMNNPETK